MDQEINNRGEKRRGVYALLGKLRLILGICFNIWILYIYGEALVNGGMRDEAWDYDYPLVPQYLIMLSCCISLFADCMLYKKKSKTMLNVLIASNLLFWLSFFMFVSCDSKTGLSYFIPYGMIAFLVIGFIMSCFHLLFFRKIYKEIPYADRGTFL